MTNINGKQSQRKGADGERELVGILRAHGFDVQRGGSLTYGTVPDLTGLPDVHIEVKRHERLETPAWLRQAQADAEKFGDGLPAVFFRQNRQGWAVVMDLKSWISLYKRTEMAKNGL